MAPAVDTQLNQLFHTQFHPLTLTPDESSDRARGLNKRYRTILPLC